jgi:hypothetical protein
MSKSSVGDSLKSYAYHEAGHAILALASNIIIPRLSILSQDYCCEVEEMYFLRGAGMDIQLGLLRYFCFLIAGKEAERKSISELSFEVDEASLDETAGVDYSLIDEKSKFLEKAEYPLTVDIGSLTQQVNTFLSDPVVWRSVQDLALKLLDSKEVHEIQPSDYQVPFFTPISHARSTKTKIDMRTNNGAMSGK